MKKYSVHFIEDAERDMADMLLYIRDHDSPARAAGVLNQLQKVCSALEQFPRRGHVPPELERIGVAEYREVHFKPYRVVYHVQGTRVYIHAILDGRRDLEAVLQRRLIR
jgi:toxin ParE1/3/4